MTAPRCSACQAPAIAELLTDAGESFPVRVWACALMLRDAAMRSRKLQPSEFGLTPPERPQRRPTGVRP